MLQKHAQRAREIASLHIMKELLANQATGYSLFGNGNAPTTGYAVALFSYEIEKGNMQADIMRWFDLPEVQAGKACFGVWCGLYELSIIVDTAKEAVTMLDEYTQHSVYCFHTKEELTRPELCKVLIAEAQQREEENDRAGLFTDARKDTAPLDIWDRIRLNMI